MTPEPLEPGLSIDRVRDGGCYVLPEGLSQDQTNLFFMVSRVGSLFVKVPTDRGLHDYRAFVRDGQVTDADIRPLEDAERVEYLPASIERKPGLARIAEADPESAHYLVVHQMQYERLRTAGLVGIPEARFATVDGPLTAFAKASAVGRSLVHSPAVFQERIPGATLWDMFDFEALGVKAAWLPFRAAIANTLRALIDSELAKHIDWNIKNFVFHGAEQRLYYVDSKPTLFVARSSNEQNLGGIRTHWLA